MVTIFMLILAARHNERVRRVDWMHEKPPSGRRRVAKWQQTTAFHGSFPRGASCGTLWKPFINLLFVHVDIQGIQQKKVPFCAVKRVMNFTWSVCTFPAAIKSVPAVAEDLQRNVTSWMQSRNAIPPYVSGWNSIAWTWSPLSRVQPGLGSVPATRWKKRLDSPDRASTANRFPINWKASPRLPVCGLRRRDIPKILHCEKGQQESWLINVWFTGS